MTARRSPIFFAAVQPRGQAAIEAALVLPLNLFFVLGALQLFMLLQARSLAEYAVMRSARAGAVNSGDCKPMVHAALGALLPSYVRFLGRATPGDRPEEKLANAFSLRASDAYSPEADDGYSGAIVWVVRRAPAKGSVPAPEDSDWDEPGNMNRLEVHLVYWFPLRIPFVDWVFSRAYLAQVGLTRYRAVNPLSPSRNADWEANGVSHLDAALGRELRERVARHEHVFPISTQYGVRFMSPPKAKFFTRQNCAPTPEDVQ